MDPEIKRNFLTICYDVYTPPWCDDDDDDDDDDDVMRWDEMQTYNKSIKSDNLQLIYKIIHTTYKKSIKTYNPLQEIYNPSLQVVYPPKKQSFAKLEFW